MFKRTQAYSSSTHADDVEAALMHVLLHSYQTNLSSAGECLFGNFFRVSKWVFRPLGSALVCKGKLCLHWHTRLRNKQTYFLTSVRWHLKDLKIRFLISTKYELCTSTRTELWHGVLSTHLIEQIHGDGKSVMFLTIVAASWSPSWRIRTRHCVWHASRLFIERWSFARARRAFNDLSVEST